MEVYDGVVLMKDQSQFYKKVWAQFKTKVLNYTSAKEEQLAFGVQAMYPDMIGELKKGTTVGELLKSISEVQGQQRERISGYPRFNTAYHATYYTAERLIDKVRLEVKAKNPITQ